MNKLTPGAIEMSQPPLNPTGAEGGVPMTQEMFAISIYCVGN